MANRQRTISALLFLGALLCAAGPAVAQTEGTYSIRVESNLVVVPTFVFRKDAKAELLTSDELSCDNANEEAFHRLRPTEPFVPIVCDETAIRGLTAKRFHLFQDGLELKIRSVTYERAPLATFARDNLGHHNEYSDSPNGKWSTSELGPSIGPGGGYFLYLISYVPPKSEVGSWHSVKVQAERRALVYTRTEYWNRENLRSDPLKGTQFGAELEKDLESQKEGEISLSLQTSSFHTEADAARVHIALEFPWNSLRRKWISGELHATIGLLGVIYREDGTVADRFSDRGCCPSETPTLARSSSQENSPSGVYPRLDVAYIPSRYEMQLDLPPGEYDLKVVLSDGEKFGRVEAHLQMDNYDAKEFGLSSVMLCKRFRDAKVAAIEAAAANLALRYVPWVSKGIEVTPTGDTRFRTGEPLIPYFEIYEPLLAAQPDVKVQAHIRILDAKTGEVVKDLAPIDAEPYMNPGSTTIPIAREVPYEQLPKGAYRMEVQATDSAGRSTVVRTAEFTVE